MTVSPMGYIYGYNTIPAQRSPGRKFHLFLFVSFVLSVIYCIVYSAYCIAMYYQSCVVMVLWPQSLYISL